MDNRLQALPTYADMWRKQAIGGAISERRVIFLTILILFCATIVKFNKETVNKQNPKYSLRG